MTRSAALLLLLGLAAGAARAGAPYPPSEAISAIEFEMGTLRRLAPGSDNWAITWADDGHQYTAWGDGGGFGGSGTRGRVALGVGRVEGSRDDYTAHNVWGGYRAEHLARFGGKSYGLLSVDGTLYMWRCGTAEGAKDSFNVQDVYRSADRGATWAAIGVEFTPADFAGNLGFFCPTFLQFGQDYRFSRDRYVYSYAPEIKNDTWNVMVPGEITLMRVLKTKIEQQSSWEFFAGLDGQREPIWSSALSDRQPAFRDSVNGVMRTSVSFNAPLKRYLLVTQQVSRFQAEDYHIGIYDAPEPWGPWTTVFFGNPQGDIRPSLNSGSKTVYWNFSNKWLSRDGRSFVLVYTGPGSDNWGTVDGRLTTMHSPQRPAPPRGLRIE